METAGFVKGQAKSRALIKYYVDARQGKTRQIRDSQIIGWSYSSFTSRPVKALNYSRLSQQGLRQMFTECLHVWTMSGPCLDNVWTVCLALVPGQLELWHFWDWVNMAKEHVYGVSTVRDNVRAMFGQCFDHVWPIFTFRPARAMKS